MRLSLLTSVAAAAFVGFIGAAQAADIVPEETMVDWSGFYVGAHVGYGEGYMSGCIECTSSSVSNAEDLNLNGITGGLHAGYNLQSDHVVYGIEADISFNDWSDRKDTDSEGEFQRASIDTLGSIRGRLGYAMDDMLFYVTGGIALSDAEWVSVRDDPKAGTKDTAHFDEIGGVVGGGVEVMAFSNVSFRAEGFYYFFDDDEDISGFSEGDPGESVSLDDMFVVRVGATWHFNGT